jgi:Ser/Thr protein kinase RdoA (MazF antagonist)
MENCRMLSGYFETNHPDYLFVSPVLSKDGQNFVQEENNYYRLFPFIENSYSCDTVSVPSLAHEAAKQFGKFTRLLSDFDPVQLHVTLPDFHNLTLRYQQFESALLKGNNQRIDQTAENISFLKKQQEIVEIYERIQNNPSFKLRVIHHDAKINNVLFDRRNNKGLCVIDLDTVMPGYFISDVGDMLRTYLSPVSEEERDFNNIEIREQFFREIVKGYLGEMQFELGEEEKMYFVYAGKFAIYMQALRFLTDYINNDIYYSIKYEDQNKVRAGNQIVLLKQFIEKEDRLTRIATEGL